MPQGTGKSHQNKDAESSMQDIQRRIFVSIQDDSTGRTDVGTDGETLFDPCPTQRTLLRSELRGNGNHWDVMHGCVVLHPLQERAPGGITDRFGEMPIAHHIADLQVFVGKEIVR